MNVPLPFRRLGGLALALAACTPAADDAAFDKLPPGTLDNLVKPGNKATLVSILYHHVTTPALELDYFADGQSLNMVGGPPW
jgi:uncharacterized surface protein with fasciclin (FAS1) repeats